jgi:hypothetical protein
VLACFLRLATPVKTGTVMRRRSLSCESGDGLMESATLHLFFDESHVFGVDVHLLGGRGSLSAESRRVCFSMAECCAVRMERLEGRETLIETQRAREHGRTPASAAKSCKGRRCCLWLPPCRLQQSAMPWKTPGAGMCLLQVVPGGDGYGYYLSVEMRI